jgi:hypothetical protein
MTRRYGFQDTFRFSYANSRRSVSSRFHFTPFFLLSALRQLDAAFAVSSPEFSSFS